MVQHTTLSSNLKKTGESDSQKSQSSSGTDKARPGASGSEPPAKKIEGLHSTGFLRSSAD